MPDKKELPAKLEVDAGRDAFAVKLRHFLGTQDEAHKAELADARRNAVYWLFGAAGLGFGAYQASSTDSWMFPFAVFGALVAFAISIICFWASFDRHDELERGHDIREFFVAVHHDLHPKTTVTGKIDLSEATDLTPERNATSPYSGAAKKWYRHPWLKLRWAFADGNLMKLELTDLVKTKSGAEIRREHQVKGQLKVNGSVYRAVGPLKLQHLRTASKMVDGGHMVYFWGKVKTHDDLLTELKLVYGALVRQAAQRASG